MKIIQLVLVLFAWIAGPAYAEDPDMAKFEQALYHVFEIEGVDSDHAADAGGKTRYGVSTRFLKLANEDINGDGHVNEMDVSALTLDDARRIYREHFWEHYRLDEFANDRLATKALDLFVNMRGTRAAKCFQSAVNIMMARPVLTVDGILGSKSIQIINGINDLELYVTHVKIEQAEVYRTIVRKDGTQRVFLVGWLRRAALG